MERSSGRLGDLTSFAARLRHYRQRAGKSRAVLGGLVGRSEEWVKALESGRLLMPRLPMLLRLADVLGVTELADLTGGVSLPTAAVRKVPHEAVPSLLDAVMAPVAPPESAPAVVALTARVDQAWQIWHTSPTERSAVAVVLPALVTELRAALLVLSGAQRRQALVELARTYHLVQLVAAFTPAVELVWLAADRALAAAQEAEDPAALAAATWYYGHVWRSAGQPDRAEGLARLAAEQLDLGQVEHRARFGQLHIGMALAVAQRGETGTARRYLDKSEEIARSLGPHYAHPWLMFGPAAVEVHTVEALAATFQLGEAVDRAERLDPSALPSRTRRSVAWRSAARAYALRGEHTAAMHLLKRAAGDSRDTTRHSPVTLELLDDLGHRPGALGREARQMAVELGLGE